MEKKVDLTGFNEALEVLKESSVKSKDYIKFIVGLSTGTILLSVTLVKEFIKFPQYDFTLIIGWVLLFISIVLGVWILPAWDNLHGKFEVMKRMFTSPENLLPMIKRKLQDHYIKELIKGIIPSQLKDEKEIKDFCESLENRSYKDLKKLAAKIGVIFIKDEYKDFAKDFIEAILNLFFVFKLYEDQAYIPNLFNSIKWILWQMKYLEWGMRYSFFIGILAILVFAVINLK